MILMMGHLESVITSSYCKVAGSVTEHLYTHTTLRADSET